MLLLRVLLAAICYASASGRLERGQSATSRECLGFQEHPAAAEGARVVLELHVGDDAIGAEDMSAALSSLLSERPLLGLKVCLVVGKEDNEIKSDLPSHVVMGGQGVHPDATSAQDASFAAARSSVASTRIVAVVDSLEDAVGPTAACATSTGACNFRTAMEYCENLLTDENITCVVQLPPFQEVWMDPGLGEVVFGTAIAGEIIVEGSGCTFRSLPSSSSSPPTRFLDGSYGFYTTMRFRNMTVDGFGSHTINGGALHFSENKALSFSDMTFSNCIGMQGGCIYISFGYDTTFERCTFINGNATISGGAIFFDVYNIAVVSDCMFQSGVGHYGGGVDISRMNDIKIFNCTFQNTFAISYGGGIYASDENYDLVISHCDFYNSTSGIYGGAIALMNDNDYSTISHCRFYESTVQGYGGAVFIYFNNYYVTVSDCYFVDCHAQAGGAIQSYTSSDDLLITDSTFVNCTAIVDGGAIHIYRLHYDVVISNNKFIGCSGISGGALYFFTENYDSMISECVFTGDSANAGGGIYLYSTNDHTTIIGCSFYNTAARDGGAIYVTVNNDDLSIVDGLFYFNEADEGGALYLGSENNRALIESSVFQNNSGRMIGGAVRIRDGNVGISFVHSILDGNSAGDYGGAVAIVSSNIGAVIKNCTFKNNRAYNAGGALHSAVSNSNMTIVDSLFSTNYASFGGGIYIGDYHEDLLVLHTVFYDNLADFGAGLYATIFNYGIVFEFSSLSRNIATIEGGGIYVQSSVLHLSSTTFESNEAPSSGAMYCGAEVVILENCIIFSNLGTGDDGSYGGLFFDAADFVAVKSSRFIANSAGSGGALGFADCFAASIDNCTFTTNFNTHGNGGAVLSISSSVDIRNSTFMNNIAKNSGGSLHIDGATTAAVSGCLFENNTARLGSGSAIWISGVPACRIADNAFISNTALRGGGTVYWVSISMDEPIGVVTSNYYSETNEAAYGNRVSTEARAFVLDPSNVYNVTEYYVPIPIVLASAVDYYQQIVRTDSSTLLSASIPTTTLCYDSVASVTGGTIEPLEEGTAAFDALLAYCDPGYSMPVTLSSTVGAISLRTQFTLWFRACVTGEYFGENVCSECELGTFSVTDPSSVAILSDLKQNVVCIECPEGAAECYGSTIVLKKGYWRISAVATSVLTCPNDGSCKGGSGSGDELCADGYEGPLCSVCSEGYSFRQYTQQCEPCSESAGLDAVTILLLVVVGIVIVIAVYLYFSPRFREKVKTLDDFYILLFSTLGLMNGGALRSVETATHIRRSIQVRVKLYITLWQVASLLPFTLGLSFPDTYEIIAAFLNIFNLGVNISSLVTCSTEASFDAIDNLVFTTTYPVAVVALLWVLRSFHLWVQREKDADVLAQISSRYFNVFLIFIYLILPFVSVIIFQTFSCKDVDPDDVEESSNRYMTEDYSVSCTSQKYRFGLIWAIASIFVYPVGVPLYYYYVLHSARQDIKSLSERSSTIDLQALSIRLKPIQMLFEFYEPKLWYWEVVETVHRLLLTGVLVVIAKGSGTQIIVGAVIALSFVKVCEIFRPYMDPSVQTLREVCQWQIFIIFFCALILKADFSSVDSFAIGILLVIAVIANVIFDLGRMLWGRWFAVSESVGKDVDDEDANNPMARSGSRMDSTVEMSVSSH